MVGEALFKLTLKLGKRYSTILFVYLVNFGRNGFTTVENLPLYFSQVLQVILELKKCSKCQDESICIYHADKFINVVLAYFVLLASSPSAIYCMI